MIIDAHTIIFNGCSDGNLEAALAHASHEKGLTVYATAHNSGKMSSLESAGIECFTLDVLGETLKSSVDEVSRRTGGTPYILVNSAVGRHYQPYIHVDLKMARDLFKNNVWGYLTVTQAFLPLLMRTPHQLRMGREPLTLPNDSPYEPIKREVENVIQGHATEHYAEDQTKWTKKVVSDLLQKSPLDQVWKGGRAGLIQLTNATEGIISNELGDQGFQQLGGLDKLEILLIANYKEKW